MAVVEFEIRDRGPFAEGMSFGDVGSYELLKGVAHCEVDPVGPVNKGITDLELAPRNARGMVEFSSNFELLRPQDPEKAKPSLLYDVVNRGRVTALSGFNRAPAYVPGAPLEAGDGFLMRHGYTVIFGGWQADVPQTPGLIGMNAPEAIGPDGPLVGKILCWFQTNEPTQVLLLSDRGHNPHPAADIDEQSAQLYVRDHPNSPAQPIDRGQWSFVRVEDESVEPEPSHVYMASGFEPGMVYELVYTTKGSTIVGLGFAAMRDVVSFLKYGDADDGNPCAGSLEAAYAVGRSQSGRFLRQYIHTGLNEDEKGRKALDGIIAHVAGGMRGEFNLRFGQPSKDICYVMPELFPFTDTEQVDPVTGAAGSLLTRLKEKGDLPKMMFTNTSAEYWRGDAALIHTDIESMTDADEDEEHVRRYHFAGAQHGSGDFPPLKQRLFDGLKGQTPYNSIEYSPLMRAALENLDAWAREGKPAPPSRHPRLTDGTAVESSSLAEKFAEIPGAVFPKQTLHAMRLDYGPEQHLGRTVQLPAIEGALYPALVSDVDEDGNELAGIRLPYLTVPVATYTGWNLRHPDNGNPDLLIGITGGLAGWTLPFPSTRVERERTGDPRRSITERYESRDDYLTKTRDAARALVDEGYMLEEDIDAVLEHAAERFDYYVEGGLGR
ncbi:MAG: hypothetical protein IH861_11985 [Chloroflexi bacterium]|nr:hypothetical protein [Chloroflexota bacterium]